VIFRGFPRVIRWGVWINGRRRWQTEAVKPAKLGRSRWPPTYTAGRAQRGTDTPLKAARHRRTCGRRRDRQSIGLRNHSDNRDNLARAQAKRRAVRSSYRREYRAAQPAYRKRNRSMRRLRNARRSHHSPIAKSLISQRCFGKSLFNRGDRPY